MKTAEEILKSKLDGKITFVNNPDYTFNKVIEAMEEYRLQSHPSPMSAEQVEELGEKYADSKYDKAIHLIGWSNTKHGFIAGHNTATTPSVKADGWVSVEDAIPVRGMKVRWRCSDGIEDIGFYYSERKVFANFDLRSVNEVTHWKPL